MKKKITEKTKNCAIVLDINFFVINYLIRKENMNILDLNLDMSLNSALNIIKEINKIYKWRIMATAVQLS